MTIDWAFELILLSKLLLSFLFGSIIGWERERSGHEAGIRTFGLISLGSCAFGIISMSVQHGDPGRIAAQIVSGIGFIGAGSIFRQDGLIKGLTTAATLWCAAAVGLAIAFNLLMISAFTTLIILLFLSLGHTRLWQAISYKKEIAQTHHKPRKIKKTSKGETN